MHIPGGYYLKARKIDDSEIAKAPPSIREVWDWLMRNANFKEVDGVKRGQLLTSYNEIIEGLSWYVGYRKAAYKKHKIETALKWMRARMMIQTTNQTANQTGSLLITVVNYSSYQNPKSYEADNETDSEPDNETDNEPDNETDPHYYKKNVKNVKKKNKSTSAAADRRAQKDKELSKFVDRMVESWNALPDGFAKVQQVTNKRKKKLAARFKEAEFRDNIGVLFKKIAASGFLAGDNPNGWVASFNWLIENDDNYNKVLEGTYDDGRGQGAGRKAKGQGANSKRSARGTQAPDIERINEDYNRGLLGPPQSEVEGSEPPSD